MSSANTNEMDCVVCVEPGTIAIETRPRPTSAPDGWILIDIAAIGICGTDYHIFEGKHPYLQYPRVLGHELSGYVVDGPDAGKLVVINPYISCGDCRACQREKYNCCSKIEVLGVHCDGGMASRVAVPVQNVYSADGLTPHQAAMVEFLAIGAHAVARSDISNGDVVLVTGAGPIGLGAALFAQFAGAEVHLMDLSDARLEQARAHFGFTNTHNTTKDLLSGNLAEGFDLVFDATGSAKAIEAGFPLLAHGGSAVLISIVKDDITFEDAEFHKREARIIGSRNALRADFERVMAAMRRGDVPTDAIKSEIIALAELPSRFSTLVENREDLVKVLVTP